MGYPQLKETSDLQKIKGVLFERCARAADQNIIAQNQGFIEVMASLDRRQTAAAHSALLGVITAAGLEDEYRKYRAERRNGNDSSRAQRGKKSGR